MEFRHRVGHSGQRAGCPSAMGVQGRDLADSVGRRCDAAGYRGGEPLMPGTVWLCATIPGGT